MPAPRLASRPYPVRAQVPLAHPYFLTEVDAPEVAGRVAPGQFVMVRVPGVSDPLLGRPFSVFAVTRTADGEAHGVVLLYNIVGRGTALLAGRRPGDDLLLLGPLGTGFRLSPAPRRALLVAGGVGIAAFYLLAEELLAAGTAVRLLYGARSAADLVTADRFERLGVEVARATDDGSAGHHGFVTALLERELAAGAGDGRAVFACGPSPMLRRVRALALERSVSCQLALESRMACGFGVCLGCAVPSAREPGTYRLVCKDGPCLEASEVLP
jgi:dihydroorotate dehydrogenase electron transfer subunit